MAANVIELSSFISQVYGSAVAALKCPLSQTITQTALKALQLALAGIREAKALTKAILLYSYGKSENFNFYGLNPKHIIQQDSPAILFLHGDKHNQSAALSLASYLKTASVGPIFTVNLDYNEENPAEHRKQLFEKIAYIKNLYTQKELKLILIGHSKGAIEGAHLAFCDQKIQGVRIEKVISIAGRLKVVPARWRSCHPELQALVNKVYQAILSRPQKPLLYTIAGNSDWNAPIEAMLANDPSIRSHILPNHSHVSVLFAEEAHAKILEFIQE